MIEYDRLFSGNVQAVQATTSPSARFTRTMQASFG
jgi:hypothetical protein